MDGRRSWKKWTLLLLCGLGGACVLGPTPVRAEVLAPRLSTLPALDAPESHGSPTAYRGFVAQGSLRSEAGLRGDRELLSLYKQIRQKLAGLRAELAQGAIMLGITMIGGHAQRLVPPPKPAPTPPVKVQT
jgi:hypothetical protein